MQFLVADDVFHVGSSLIVYFNENDEKNYCCACCFSSRRKTHTSRGNSQSAVTSNRIKVKKKETRFGTKMKFYMYFGRGSNHVTFMLRVLRDKFFLTFQTQRTRDR